MPLYAATALQSFVFWYGIEKLFMTSIGFTPATIAVMIAAYSTVNILCEIPSGILADRWSRKGTLVLGGIALAIASLLGGLSNGESLFIIAMIFWGIFFAAQSGTSDSIIYDTLLEIDGHAKHYKKFLSLDKIIGGIALVVSSIASGFIAESLGLREAFFLSVPFALASIVALAILREPILHKHDESEKIFVHIKQTFAAVLKRRQTLSLLAALLCLGLVSQTALEFNQLWLIAISTPVLIFGAINALVISSFALSGVFAHRINHHAAIYATLIAVCAACVGLAFSRNFIVIGVLQTIVCTGVMAVAIILTHQLHDLLPSRVRAGAASAIGSLIHIALIPFAMLFGLVASGTSIFSASYLLLTVAVAGIIMTFISQRLRRSSTI